MSQTTPQASRQRVPSALAAVLLMVGVVMCGEAFAQYGICRPVSQRTSELNRLLDHGDRVKEAVSHSHESFRDARIRAAFAIAPVLGPAMTKTSLAEIKVPVRIIVGSKDDQASPNVNARPLGSAIPNAELEVLPNVPHYTFLARCNLLGKVVARSFCTDPDQIDSEEVHRRVGTDALKFFDRPLQREP